MKTGANKDRKYQDLSLSPPTSAHGHLKATGAEPAVDQTRWTLGLILCKESTEADVEFQLEFHQGGI